MKKLFLLLLPITIALAACSSDDAGTSKTENPYDKSISGTLSKCEPPEWTVTDGITYDNMPVIIDEYALPCAIGMNDMIAGFINGKCRGVARQPRYDEGEGYWRFNLTIYGVAADENAGSTPKVEIRYYSALQGGIYVSAPFPYSGGSILGKNLKGQGYRPVWK